MDTQFNRGEPRKVSASARQLEDDVAGAIPLSTVVFNPGYRAAGYIRAGLLLGGLAGCTSLLFNVVGSVLWPAISGEPQHPLRIIQVYLTFPLGETALQLDSGVLLAAGCVAYLATGMLYGTLFEWIISCLIPNSRLLARIVFCSVFALLIWGVNFYAILTWLQPLLFGHRWIVELIPWWVAALTHLVFGWTMALVFPLGIPKGEKSTIVV
jgi:hypothetical protein